MEFNLFLWPMLVPMIIPLLYCFKYKRGSLVEVGTITLVMGLIVILYVPMADCFWTPGNIAVKFLLFVILPITGLLVVYVVKKILLKRNISLLNLNWFGIKKEGLKKSFWLCVLFLPIMLGITFAIKYIGDVTYDADVLLGTISFFEAFTEEFFFRGVLFIFLLSLTDIRVAYITSLVSFVLMHPQHLESFENFFFISTIVQGVLTIEISRRSGNITGAWLLHGINRFFIIVLVPLLLLS